MSSRRARFALTLAFTAFAAGAIGLAHIRLRHPGSGAELAWPDAAHVALVVSPVGSDDLAARGHEAAVRNAIDAWNTASGQAARLVEDASDASRARTDWGATDLHLVFFDESDATGYFPPGGGAVAITPVWFLQSGEIVDADVIFNGRDFHFTTSGQPGRFDVQDVATHELGHFLGLDHSGWAGSTMYPFVDPEVVLHRSLSWDEISGLRDAYPAAAHASIVGTVRRVGDDSVVAGAHIVALDVAGRTRASKLSGLDGRFEVEGLAGGTYRLYATPLDEPVSSGYLGPGWTIQTDFRSTNYGSVAVGDAQTFDIGDLRVDSDVNFGLGLGTDRLPLRGVAGTTASYQLGGRGLVAGSTLTASDPSVTVAPTTWGVNHVEFQLSIPVGAPAGHFDLIASGAAGARSFLVAAVEVTPPDPVVDFATPAEGPPQGGTAVLLKGSGFRPGARVVMGGEIYVDGASGGASVIDDATITVTTRASLPGTTDVVVIDSSGVEGRLTNGFRFIPLPVVASVFPAAGSTAGGTPVVIRGKDFAPGATVRISGVLQTLVSFAPDELVIGQTAPGPANGAPLLEVRNPDGEMATGTFDYVSSPDPLIATVAPGESSAGGGELITLAGSDFRPNLQVFFGADPATGTGGTLATSVEFFDASTLRAKTPARPPGPASVMVLDASTQQASLVAGAVTFHEEGGGGCHAVPLDRTVDPFEAATALLGLALLAFALRALAPRAAFAHRA